MSCPVSIYHVQAEIQEQLRARGLPDNGKKGSLVTRLREAQQREALSSAGRSNPSSGQAYKVRTAATWSGRLYVGHSLRGSEKCVASPMQAWPDSCYLPKL